MKTFEMDTEIEALQNAATQLNLVIYEKYTQDKRKKVKMYFANMGNETVSPTLPYNKLNTFLLGWIRSKKRNYIDTTLYTKQDMIDMFVMGFHNKIEGKLLDEIAADILKSEFKTAATKKTEAIINL